MSNVISAADAAFERALAAKTLGDIDLDAFADGVLAHRRGAGFHENPHGHSGMKTAARLSWALGWNERALQCGDP